MKKLCFNIALALPLSLVAPSALAANNIEPASCNFLPASFCGGTIDDLVSGVGTWLVGLIIAASLIMIVVSGAQMASAADSPDRLKAAKGRLTGAIVALVFLLLFRAIMAWLGVTV